MWILLWTELISQKSAMIQRSIGSVDLFQEGLEFHHGQYDLVYITSLILCLGLTYQTSNKHNTGMVPLKLIYINLVDQHGIDF